MRIILKMLPEKKNIYNEFKHTYPFIKLEARIIFSIFMRVL